MTLIIPRKFLISIIIFCTILTIQILKNSWRNEKAEQVRRAGRSTAFEKILRFYPKDENERNIKLTSLYEVGNNAGGAHPRLGFPFSAILATRNIF